MSAGVDLRIQGRYAEALSMEQDTLVRSERVRGENDAQTLRVATNLAVSHRMLGDFQAAHETGPARPGVAFRDPGRRPHPDPPVHPQPGLGPVRAGQVRQTCCRASRRLGRARSMAVAARARLAAPRRSVHGRGPEVPGQSGSPHGRRGELPAAHALPRRRPRAVPRGQSHLRQRAVQDESVPVGVEPGPGGAGELSAPLRRGPSRRIGRVRGTGPRTAGAGQDP